MAENHLTTACAGTSMVGTGRSSPSRPSGQSAGRARRANPGATGWSSPSRPPDTGSLVPGLVASALEVLVSVRALRDLVPLLDVDLLVTRRAVEVTGLLRLLAGLGCHDIPPHPSSPG